MAKLTKIKPGMANIAEVINKDLELLNDSLDVLSNGFWYMNAETTIFPSKKIDECKTGWILQWQATNDGKTKLSDNFHYFHVPKAIISENGAKPVAGLSVPLFANSGSVIGTSLNSVLKYVYIKNDRITGHVNNSKPTDNDGSGTHHWVMTAVYEY